MDRKTISGIFSICVLLVTGCVGAGSIVKPPDGHWRIIELSEQPLRVDSVAPTMELRFDEAMVSGMAGCNRYSGGIEASSGTSLRFGPIAATKMACLDGDRMVVEAAFLSMLERVRGQRRGEDGELLLLDNAGRVLARLRSEGR